MKKVKRIHIADMQPFFMIALYPRATIRFCLMFKPLIYFFFIGIVGAFSSELAKFVKTNYQFQFTLGDLVSSSMIFSVIAFVTSTAIAAIILQFLGSSLGGKGTFKQMFQALSLTYIPFIWILPMLLFWMQLSPESYFIYGDFTQSVGDKIMGVIGLVVILLASIWTLFLVLKAIQEVQRFSMAKAIIALAICILTISIVIYAMYAVTGIIFI